MKGSVEHTHLRQTRHQFTDSAHTLQVGRVVQRCQVDTLFEYVEHFFGEQYALIEFLAAMHHAVAYGVNLFQVFDDTNLRVGEQGEDKLPSLCMLGNVVHDFFLGAVGQFYLHE